MSVQKDLPDMNTALFERPLIQLSVYAQKGKMLWAKRLFMEIWAESGRSTKITFYRKNSLL